MSPTLTLGNHNLYKLNSALCQESFMYVWAILGKWLSRKKISVTSPIFFIFMIISLWRRPGPLFEQFKIPFTQGWFVPSLIEIDLLVLERIFLYKQMWIWLSEMTKITNSNLSHKSYRKYKSENGRTRTSEYIRGGIRCHGGVSIPCWPVAPAVSPVSKNHESNQCV